MESYCRICGLYLENISEDVKCCDSEECQKRYRNLLNNPKKKKKIARMRSFEIQFREWSSGCIDNLYKNMLENWTAEMTAKETNRDVEDVRKMMDRIKSEGFENIYYELLTREKELKKRVRKNSDTSKDG